MYLYNEKRRTTDIRKYKKIRDVLHTHNVTGKKPDKKVYSFYICIYTKFAKWQNYNIVFKDMYLDNKTKERQKLVS